MTIRLNGSTSGYSEIDAPAVAGNTTLILPPGNGSAYQVLRNGATAGTTEFADKIVSGTAVASTSGTSIDFTGIPSWVKRVTVMFSGVSTNGTSNPIIQIGAGSVDATGYTSSGCNLTNTSSVLVNTYTTGFGIYSSLAANILHGSATICLIGSNNWAFSGSFALAAGAIVASAGTKTLSGTLDRVRITTVNGTDTFDAGSINLLWE